MILNQICKVYFEFYQISEYPTVLLKTSKHIKFVLLAQSTTAHCPKPKMNWIELRLCPFVQNDVINPSIFNQTYVVSSSSFLKTQTWIFSS